MGWEAPIKTDISVAVMEATQEVDWCEALPSDYAIISPSWRH